MIDYSDQKDLQKNQNSGDVRELVNGCWLLVYFGTNAVSLCLYFQNMAIVQWAYGHGF